MLGESESTWCQYLLNIIPEYAAISREGKCTLTYVIIVQSVPIIATFSKNYTKFCQMDVIID